MRSHLPWGRERIPVEELLGLGGGGPGRRGFKKERVCEPPQWDVADVLKPRLCQGAHEAEVWEPLLLECQRREGQGQ